MFSLIGFIYKQWNTVLIHNKFSVAFALTLSLAPSGITGRGAQ